MFERGENRRHDCGGILGGGCKVAIECEIGIIVASIGDASHDEPRQAMLCCDVGDCGALHLDEVCAGIADAIRASGLEMLLVGRFPPALQAQLAPARLVPWLEPGAYLELLAREPLIAVAPLSRSLPPAQQRFADCKSDIKIAHYASSRIAGLYSDTPPFADSELPRRIVANTRAAWRDALVVTFASAG